MKITYLYLIIVFVLFAATGLLWFGQGYINEGDLIDHKCTTNLEMTELHFSLHTRVNLTLVFNKDQTGYIDISGSVSHEHTKTIISRRVDYNYVGKGRDIYHITKMKTIKNSSDNTDDSVFNSFVIINNGNERYIEINKVAGGLLISNMHSPVFLCVKSS